MKNLINSSIKGTIGFILVLLRLLSQFGVIFIKDPSGVRVFEKKSRYFLAISSNWAVFMAQMLTLAIVNPPKRQIMILFAPCTYYTYFFRKNLPPQPIKKIEKSG